MTDAKPPRRKRGAIQEGPFYVGTLLLGHIRKDPDGYRFVPPQGEYFVRKLASATPGQSIPRWIRQSYLARKKESA